MKIIYLSLSLLILATACKYATSKENTEDDKTAAVKATTAIPDPASSGQKGTTSFSINGTAVTQNHEDTEPGINYNISNRNMSLYLFGDVASQPCSGMLQISKAPFDLKPGTYDCAAGFTRYTQVDGGGQNINYHGKSFSVTFTRIDPTGDKRVWLASGTFSGELPLGIYEKPGISDAMLKITDGKFNNIRLTQLGNP